MNKINKGVTLLFLSIMSLFAMAQAAVAQDAYVDPTGGAVTAAGGDITDFVYEIGLPVMLSVAVVGVIVGVAVKYVRRLRGVA